jgi:hypothetical protein
MKFSTFMSLYMSICLMVALPFVVSAQQSHPDIPLTPTSGVYGVTCAGPDDTDMFELCLVRSDSVPVIELACEPAGPSAEVRIEFELVSTPNDDAEIRCYARDTTGLVSDYSENAGIVDFTPPGIPHVM